MKQIIRVEQMSCQHCVNHVSQHFLELEGVSAVSVDLEQKEATVTTDIRHSLSDFQDSLKETVYEAVAIKEVV